MGSMLGLVHQSSESGGMPWPQTGATHYHAQLGLPVKGSTIKRLVFCYVIWLVWESLCKTQGAWFGPLLSSRYINYPM